MQASNITNPACVDSFVVYNRIVLVLLRRAMPIMGFLCLDKMLYSYIRICILSYYIVWIHVFYKIVCNKYTDDLLLPLSFWSAHPVDTLLSHEAPWEDLWMPVYINSTLYRTSFFNSHKVCTKSCQFRVQPNRIRHWKLQWFSILVVKCPSMAHFGCLPSATHLINIMSLLVEPLTGKSNHFSFTIQIISK